MCFEHPPCRGRKDGIVSGPHHKAARPAGGARGPAIAKVLGGAPLGETAFGLNAAKKDLACAVQIGASIAADLPVTATALACYEEAEAAGLGDADPTAGSTRWAQPTNKPYSPLPFPNPPT